MKFVAVTSCPTGIAHSQMAAEGLEQSAANLGHEIRVEIQGAMGAEDELTSEEIAEADAVIIAADTSVSRDRFEGKPVVKSKVAKAINEGEELIEEAVAKAGGDAGSAETSEATDEGTTESPATEAGDTATSETAAESSTDPSTSSDQRTQSENKGLIGKLKSLFS